MSSANSLEQQLKQVYQGQPVSYQIGLPFFTLLKKEVLRITSVAVQTLIVPVTPVTLYLLVFGVSLGQRVSLFEGTSYVQFVIPGLILMGVVQNTFGNSSSSLFMARYLGYVVDYLVAPLSPSSMTLAYTLSSMARGLTVGVAIFFISLFFAEIAWPHPFLALAMALVVSFLFSQLGIIAAVYSDNFDRLSVFTNFLILPAIYLGGLFYPVALLPEPWSTISKLNPLYYMIDGFRFCALGTGELSFGLSFTISVVLGVALFFWASKLVKNRSKLV